MNKQQILGLTGVAVASIVMVIALAGGCKRKPDKAAVYLYQAADSTPIIISTKGPDHLVRWQSGTLVSRGLKQVNQNAWASQPEMIVLDSAGKPFKGDYISVNTVGKAGQ